ncbi:MAG: hypothetical protein JNL70_00895 [Saprospiraceae bacterium]|nr:hypothetical protein [Saprospiraceae bacterium]
MRLVLNIEDHRINFFLELLNSLDFVAIEKDAPELTLAEKQFIDNRLLHHAQNKDKSILWSDLKLQLENE